MLFYSNLDIKHKSISNSVRGLNNKNQITVLTFLNSVPALRLPPLDTQSKVCSAVPNDEVRLTSMISPDDKLKKYPSSNSSSSPNELNSQSLVTNMPGKNYDLQEKYFENLLKSYKTRMNIFCTHVQVSNLLTSLQSKRMPM